MCVESEVGRKRSVPENLACSRRLSPMRMMMSCRGCEISWDEYFSMTANDPEVSDADSEEKESWYFCGYDAMESVVFLDLSM
jgi:hypothetical protein